MCPAPPGPMLFHGEKPVRVMVVDDHPAVRRGVTAVLDAVPDITVCAQIATTLNLDLSVTRCEVAQLIVRLQGAQTRGAGAVSSPASSSTHLIASSERQ